MEVEKRLDADPQDHRGRHQEYGIAPADIVIDPLAMPIGADQEVVNTPARRCAASATSSA
jgi:5-methyltetrahydrofolate--homocysteine methyltransferase